jgi:hypothetical protein
VENLVSYDRLAPDPLLGDAITVKVTGSGRFRAVAVPPTFTLGPYEASRLLVVDGIEEVIDRMPSISAERRRFLIERIPYWKAWAKGPRKGITNSGDRE